MADTVAGQSVPLLEPDVTSRGAHSAETALPQTPLRIAFVSSVFPPEPPPSAVMAWQLARCLRTHGHEVTVISPFPNRPGGRIYSGYQRRFRQVETWEGVRIVRCPTWLIGPARRPWNRLLENLSFGLSSALALAMEQRPDVMLLETWPLAAAQLCASCGRIRGVPVLYYVKDVYPEALETCGVIETGASMARALRAWDRHICLMSDKVIAISESMQDMLIASRQLPPGQVVVIPDWIDEEEFRPVPRYNSWRREMQLPQELFVALFAGTLGLVSGADVLVQTAHRLRGVRDIVLLCVGEGVVKDRMIAEANALGLTNLRFEPFQERARVPEMHAAADACLLTMRRDASNSSVPSKLITYMAAARPVICATPPGNDVARIVCRAQAGVVVPPEDPDELAAAILQLRHQPETKAAMGSAGRSWFERELSFSRRYEQFMNIIGRVALPGRT